MEVPECHVPSHSMIDGHIFLSWQRLSHFLDNTPISNGPREKHLSMVVVSMTSPIG